MSFRFPTDNKHMRRIAAIVLTITVFALLQAVPERASAGVPPPLAALRAQMRSLASRVPASTAVEVLDLSTGYSVGYNAGESMPAASTIKIPVMVEVFRQLERGRFDLQRHVTLLASDKDYGSGELCSAPAGSSYPVSELLSKMIDVSDNTATNMLIRLVGRRNINSSMTELGLERTRLTSDVRTSGWSVRETLRSSPADMVHLLAMMAKRQLVDEWSSGQMIAILEDDQYNTLIPAPLPEDVPIAHKTGSFFDTLNDVGIVYEQEAPYVMAVMTTGLPSQNLGRAFIHTLSRDAFDQEQRLAQWRGASGIQTFVGAAPASLAPDIRYWSNSAPDTEGAGGGI